MQYTTFHREFHDLPQANRIDHFVYSYVVFTRYHLNAPSVAAINFLKALFTIYLM